MKHMVQCYPEEYLKEYEVLDEQWDDGKHPDAEQRRDRRARELRKQGWTVETHTWNMIDLARCYVYSLHAEKKK